MKKLLIILIAIMFTSCSYWKDESIINEYPNTTYYMVRVFPPLGLTNTGASIIYKIPMEGINDKKVDSINKVADKFIEHCEKYTNK